MEASLPSPVSAPNRARRMLVTGAALAFALGLAAWLLLRLPAGPASIWVPVPRSLDPKPFASAHREPEGASVRVSDYRGAWFQDPDGRYPRGDAWDGSLRVVLTCETPLARRALLFVVARNEHESVFARYRATPERRVIGETTWVRYERE